MSEWDLGLVSIGREGRVTLPAKVRKALNLGKGAQLMVELVGEGEAILLRPYASVPRNRAWALKPESMERVRRSQTAKAAGEVVRVSREEMEDMLLGHREPLPADREIRVQFLEVAKDAPLEA